MMKPTLVITILVATHSLAAAEDSSVSVYKGENMVVLGLLTNKDPLPDVVAPSAQAKQTGAVRCLVKDQVPGVEPGCYVGVKRDGTLVAPAFVKGGPDRLFKLPLDATFHSAYVGKNLELTIGGAAAAAVGLWIGCEENGRAHGTITCDSTTGASGKWAMAIRFQVLGGGSVQASGKR